MSRPPRPSQRPLGTLCGPTNKPLCVCLYRIPRLHCLYIMKIIPWNNGNVLDVRKGVRSNYLWGRSILAWIPGGSISAVRSSSMNIINIYHLLVIFKQVCDPWWTSKQMIETKLDTHFTYAETIKNTSATSSDKVGSKFGTINNAENAWTQSRVSVDTI